MSEPLQTTRDIEVITGEILFFKAQAGGAILEIGRRLIEAKEQLDHGQWLPWLNERVELSERVAQNFMRLSREWSNPNTFSDLGPSKALALLVLPESERENFISEPHQVNGQEKTVQEMSHSELKQAIRERDEARQAAEAAQAEAKTAKTEAKTAKEARAQAERNLKAANASIKGYKDDVKTLIDEADRLQAELNELKSRPVEVAVETREPTAEELEKLTAKAVAEAQASDRERIASMEKQLAAADGDVSAFRVHYEAWQESFNKMSGYLVKISGRDPERGGKLRMAVGAAVERMAVGCR